MDVTFRMPAEPDERFAPGCLDGQLDGEVTVKLGIGGQVRGVLRGATVKDDGRSLEVTIELPDDAESIIFRPKAGEYSIARSRP